MEAYNPEVARAIYKSLKLSDNWDFPITAHVVNGILENFVYWEHTKYPEATWETVHLQVSWKILNRPSWTDGIRDGVQELLDTRPNSQQKAA